MASLLAACAFFLGIHVVISGSPLRGVIVGRIGERASLGLFSLLSLMGMVWLARAYARADGSWLWTPPLALRWVAPLLILVALLFVVVGLTTSSPTAAGGEGRLDAQEPARGILRITRHPFPWGVALWAIMHLVGPLLIDAKRRRAFGPKWERFVAVTSNVPFAAVAAGRNAMRLGEIGTWRIALAVALWAALLVVHPWLFGVSALPP